MLPQQAYLNAGIVLEKKEDGLYYVGITNGIQDKFFLRTKDKKKAVKYAKRMKRTVDEHLNEIEGNL